MAPLAGRLVMVPPSHLQCVHDFGGLSRGGAFMGVFPGGIWHSEHFIHQTSCTPLYHVLLSF